MMLQRGGWSKKVSNGQLRICLAGKLTSVAHNKLTKTSIARQFCCSGFSMMGSRSNKKKTVRQATSVQRDELASHGGKVILPKGVRNWVSRGALASSPCNLLVTF